MDVNQPTSWRGPVRPGSWPQGRLGWEMVLGLLGMLLFAAAPVEAQQRITGRVTGATGNTPAIAGGSGLAGVRVAVQGTNTATTTDPDGRYEIIAPSTESTLVFTLAGYSPLSVVVGPRDEINVELAPQIAELEGLVVIGYGEKSKPTLTESVGIVDAEEIQKVTIATPEAAIQGRVTGVQVTSESGVPGAPVQMRIRGVGTVGNAQPLFVIDGVPVGKGTGGTVSPLATINPNDIESISILKDASAASVYGMQAANGVVLIETRRGKLGKPTIRYDGYTGIQQFPEYYDLLEPAEWLELQQDQVQNANEYFGRGPDDSGFARLPVEIQEGSPLLPELLARDTDWGRIAVHENAPIQNHNVSVSGATDQVNYYVSGGYFEQDAIIEKWDLTRYSFRANSDFNVNDRVRIGETFSLSNQVTLRGSANYGDGTILNNLLQQPPILRAFDPALISATNPRGITGNAELGSLMRPNLNSTNQLVDVTDRTTRVLGQVYGEVDIFEGLTFRSANSVDYQVGNLYFFQNEFTNETAGFARPTIAEDIRQEGYALVFTNTLNYATNFGDHDVSVLAGAELNKYRNNSLSLQTTNFLSTDFTLRRIAALGDQLLKKGGGAFEVNRLGFFGRVNYDYADRYLFTATVRRDGVSYFAPGNQWGVFPAFSAGWRISEEPFFNVDWIDELKLRGSWGQLGNADIPGGAYPQNTSVLLWAEYEIGGAVRLAPTPQPRLRNANLSWETNVTTDFGFEASLFGNSVDLAATYYQRNTEDFLLDVPVPLLSGARSVPINVGEVRNRGFELEAGYNTRIRDAVDFSISGNLTTLDNELVSLTEGLEQFNQQDFYRTSVGQPIGYFYGYKTCDVPVFQSDPGEDYEDTTIGNNRPQAGDMCFQDVDDDGVIDPGDRTYLGKTIPDAYFGINLNAGYKNFDFTAFFNGLTGVQKYNALGRELRTMVGSDNQLEVITQRYTDENPSRTIPRAIGGDPAGNNRLSDRWIEDGDYLRLKTLQVGYTLPDNIFGTGATGTRLYVSATNLWTLTDYSGLDPEFSTRGNAFNAAQNQSQLAAGTDDGNIPQPRSFQIGVTTTF